MFLWEKSRLKSQNTVLLDSRALHEGDELVPCIRVLVFVCVLVCLASVKYAVCIDLLFGRKTKLSNASVPRACSFAQIIPVQFGNV